MPRPLVCARFGDRMDLMLTEHDPLFPNWDQDAAALEGRYEEQDAVLLLEDLASAAVGLIDRLEGMSADDWQRRGRRSDGSF
jgi:hypothetical protein